VGGWPRSSSGGFRTGVAGNARLPGWPRVDPRRPDWGQPVDGQRRRRDSEATSGSRTGRAHHICRVHDATETLSSPPVNARASRRVPRALLRGPTEEWGRAVAIGEVSQSVCGRSWTLQSLHNCTCVRALGGATACGCVASFSPHCVQRCSSSWNAGGCVGWVTAGSISVHRRAKHVPRECAARHANAQCVTTRTRSASCGADARCTRCLDESGYPHNWYELCLTLQRPIAALPQQELFRLAASPASPDEPGAGPRARVDQAPWYS
jgi:hypothetical protein